MANENCLYMLITAKRFILQHAVINMIVYQLDTVFMHSVVLFVYSGSPSCSKSLADKSKLAIDTFIYS